MIEVVKDNLEIMIVNTTMTKIIDTKTITQETTMTKTIPTNIIIM
jgi:hypothetical protein